MGLAGIIRNWEAPFWRQAPFSENRRPGSTSPRFSPDNPAAAQTPGEALAYIEKLYKAGRIEEVAGWLRRSPAFREAWQAIQQASQQYATAEAAILALRSGRFTDGAKPQAPANQPNLPVPFSSPPAPARDEASPFKTEAELLTLLGEESYPAHPPAPPDPSRPLAQGYRIYAQCHRYFSQPPDLIDVRV